MLRKLVLLFFLIFTLSELNSFIFAKQTEKTNDKEEIFFRLWIGYNTYKMKEFNEKLRSENNKPIKSGMSVGLEFNAIEINKLGLRITAPFGIEYFYAESNTVHTYTDGSVTVDWKIPIIGIFIAPEIFFNKMKGFYWRPIGIGYYNLGKIFKARLIVTDRPGRLEVSSDSVGILTMIGLKYSKDIFDIFVEGGFRWLEFTDVFLDPKDGFTESAGGPPVQPGYLKESLDYSGALIRIGIKIRPKTK